MNYSSQTACPLPPASFHIRHYNITLNPWNGNFFSYFIKCRDNVCFTVERSLFYREKRFPKSSVNNTWMTTAVCFSSDIANLISLLLTNSITPLGTQ